MEATKEKTKDKKRKKKPRKRAGGPRLPIYRCRGFSGPGTPCMRMCAGDPTYTLCYPVPLEG